eukprot:1119045-Rhodomonas_salina.1
MARSRANGLRGPSLESPTQEEESRMDAQATAASRLPHKCPHGEPRVSRATWKSSKPPRQTRTPTQTRER